MKQFDKRFNEVNMKTQSFIILVIIVVVIIGCMSNKSSQVNEVSATDSCVVDESVSFYTKLGLSPDTISFADIKKFEYKGGIPLSWNNAKALVGGYTFDDILNDSLETICTTLIGVIPVNDNCAVGAYRIDYGDGQKIYLISYNRDGSVQDCVFTGSNWGYGDVDNSSGDVEISHSDETNCEQLAPNRFAIINAFIENEHNVLTDKRQEIFRRVNRFEYTIKPNGRFEFDTTPQEFSANLNHNEIALCDTLYLYYDYYMRFPMSDNSVFDLWNKASLIADASLAESLGWHIRELAVRNPPQLLQWICEHKEIENLSHFLDFDGSIPETELRSIIKMLPNKVDRKYMESKLRLGGI